MHINELIEKQENIQDIDVFVTVCDYYKKSLRNIMPVKVKIKFVNEEHTKDIEKYLKRINENIIKYRYYEIMQKSIKFAKFKQNGEIVGKSSWIPLLGKNFKKNNLHFGDELNIFFTEQEANAYYKQANILVQEQMQKEFSDIEQAYQQNLQNLWELYNNLDN